MKFFKAQATGNDFIIVNEATWQPTESLVSALCHRHFGIGSDGLVHLRQGGANNLFEWTFYNPDGREAEMCGNAARATTWFLHSHKQQSEVVVKTQRGQFVGRTLHKEFVEIETTMPAEKIQKKENMFQGQFREGYLTNTGVPHFVVQVQKLEDVLGRAQELAPYIYDPAFGPRGSNLTFFAPTGENELLAVTLERGVNDFTLSCGTGVLAAAKVYLHLKNTQNRVQVKAPGGHLAVEIIADDRAKLSGEAKLVFEGSIE
jgi:diaminopimelate epimerase